MNLNVGPKPLKGTYCRPLKGSPRPRGAEGCAFDGHDEIALCQAGLAGKWILKLVITVRLLHVLLRRRLLLLLLSSAAGSWYGRRNLDGQPNM